MVRANFAVQVQNPSSLNDAHGASFILAQVRLAMDRNLCHLCPMPKRIKHRSKAKRPRDINQLAHLLVEQSTAIPEIPQVASAVPANISEYMAQIGRKGGQIGGKRRLSTLSEKERKAIASKAAKARWSKKT